MKRTIALAVAAGLLAASAAHAQSDAPIKIGAVLSLSGPAAVFGLPERDAIEAVVEEINKTGGVNGRKIQLVLHDDKTDPAEAVRGVTQVQRDGVVAIVGPSTGSGILAAGPVAERLRVPLLGPAGTASITDKKNSFYPWVFRAAAADQTQIRKILTDIAKDGRKRIGVFYQEDAYGKVGLDYGREIAKELGLEVVAAVSAGYTATDLTAQATQLREAKPDAVFMQVSIPALGATFNKGARQAGLSVPLYGNAGLAQKTFIDAMGESGNGVRVLSIGNLPYEPIPPETKLVELLKARGRTPQGWGELVGSNGLMAIVAAIKTVKGELNGASMRDALETICDFPTYSRGKACFSKEVHDGWGADSLVITEIENGRFKTRP
ncbi:MAG: ABC transporter substrate-binding protein [Reyranellaceae bacterium]